MRLEECMKLAQILNKNCLVADIQSTDKNSVIKDLLSHCDLALDNLREEEIYQLLLDREEEQTTALGEGVAFPHVRLSGLTKLQIVIGCSKKGIDFKAMDKKPVHFVILMLVDRTKPNELLKTRAAIAKLLAKEINRIKMPSADSGRTLLDIIESSDITVDYEITAKDIMRPFISFLHPELTIRDAARELHKHHIDSLPVIDEQKIFRGELSCHDLFAYGLPVFFNNLHVISFVKHMNPFEKYFKVDKTLKVKDILRGKSKSNLVVSADATLMEIIFEMTVKNKEVLYVLDVDGKFKGVLDRYSIIDKIIIAR